MEGASEAARRSRTSGEAANASQRSMSAASSAASPAAAPSLATRHPMTSEWKTPDMVPDAFGGVAR
jgi:hypothetical protein